MSGSLNAPQQQQVGQKQEFVIRIAPKDDLQRWSILKFNQADNVDPAKWTAANNVHMEREDNKNVVLSNQSVQEYGEGSEYGKAAREEARRKKYGRQARHYNLDSQPWRLTYTDNDKRDRRFNSIREGDGHADYWIFMKQGDEFHAHKIDEMHRFTPAITHKTLDADAAEEKFMQRNKVMNQFALKAQILSQVKGDEEEKELQTAKNALLKIKDGYSSEEEDEGRGDDDEDGGAAEKKKNKKKTKAQGKARKDKRQRVENSDDVAKYESSDGEDEGREYDYMTDSGSDSGREDVKVEEKMEKELVGVGDESGLKKMMDSDESESDSDEDIMRKILNGETKKEEGDPDVEDRDSSGSDTDDPDKEKMSSVVFMPNVQNKDFPSSSVEQGKKRPAGEGGDESNPAKKTKSEPVSNEGLNEETVRKYLRRKPHTTKELLSKVKGKCGELPKAEIVTRLAAILKAIEPQQFKQKVGKKEVLFFSLGNQLAR